MTYFAKVNTEMGKNFDCLILCVKIFCMCSKRIKFKRILRKSLSLSYLIQPVSVTYVIVLYAIVNLGRNY